CLLTVLPWRKSFQILDRLTISVVLSVAYRNCRNVRRANSDRGDVQGMANVDDQNTPGSAKSGSTGTLERGERGDRVGVKALPREDEAHMDPDEYARLLDVYDSSFRNIAEGEVVKAYADRKVVIGRVIERIKGGLAVDIGVRAFLPGSQIDVRPVRNLDALRGQELRMRVIKVNKKRGNIVLSRKALLEEENAE